MKKLLSGILAVVFCMGCLSLFPVAASGNAGSNQTLEVANAQQLKDIVAQINSGELAADTNITLTADIDLSNVQGWKPLKNYKGTFDGAGFTIKNLAHAVTIANNDNDKLDGGKNTKEYVITQSSESQGANCFGQVGMALLVVKGEGATLKNFTLKDSSLNVKMNFNKNWQPYYGCVAAYLDGGIISGVKLENVDMSVCNQAGINQGFLGFAGLMAGVTLGGVTIESCSIDADSMLDASANKKFDAAAYVGRHSETSPLTIRGCTTAATVKAHPNATNKDGLMYTAGDAQLGGWAAAFVARFNDNVAEGSAKDLIYRCANTGSLSGTQGKVGDYVGDIADINRLIRVYEDNPDAKAEIISNNTDKNGVQFRQNDDGSYDARFVIEAVSDLLGNCESATLVLDFTLSDGDMRSKSMNQVTAYAKVTSHNEVITSEDGYSLMGVVVKGVDYERIHSVSATIILIEGETETVIPIGTAIIPERTAGN